jgi:hypothetical protein
MVVTGSGVGILKVGEDDSVVGSVAIYGNATDSGGALYIYNAANYDTTINYYKFASLDDNLEIGPDTDANSLKYVGATGQWQFTNLAGAYFAGDIVCGVDDVNPGILTLYGGDEDFGGRLVLYNAADADGTAEYWQLSSEENDSGNSELVLQTNTGGIFLRFEDSHSTIQVQSNIIVDITAAGSLLKTSSNGWQINGVNVNAEAAELNTKEFTVFLPNLDSTSEISFVSSVSGTVTQVYSSVNGDPGADVEISGQINNESSFVDIDDTSVVSITITNGSPQHTVDSMTIYGNNTVTAGDTVRFISDGSALNSVGTWLTVVITL